MALAGAAHDLKGTLSFFGPTSAGAAAVSLQKLAPRAGLSEIQHAYEVLQRHVSGLGESLRQLMAEEAD